MLGVARGGRYASHELFEIEHLDTALARFEELRAGERSEPPALLAEPTLACAALERWWSALDVGAATDDWQPLRAVCEPVVAFEDRQRFSRVAVDLELAIESLRARVGFGARIEGSLLGTAGDRVAIARAFWSGGSSYARFEFEYFPLVEVAESGRICAITLFDDTRTAQREAWARWAALDPVAAPWVVLLNEITDAWNAHDAGRVRNTFADEFVVEDHRFAGIGRIESAAVFDRAAENFR